MTSNEIRGKNLSDLMSKLAISQVDLEEISGVRRSVISRLLDGTSKWRSGPMLKRLSATFGMTPTDLERVLDGQSPVVDAAKAADTLVKEALDRAEKRKKLRASVADVAQTMADSSGETLTPGVEMSAVSYLEKHVGYEPEKPLIENVLRNMDMRLRELMTEMGSDVRYRAQSVRIRKLR